MAEVESGSGDALRKLYRANVANRLALQRLLAHFKIEDVTDKDVDEALDRE